MLLLVKVHLDQPLFSIKFCTRIQWSLDQSKTTQKTAIVALCVAANKIHWTAAHFGAGQHGQIAVQVALGNAAQREQLARLERRFGVELQQNRHLKRGHLWWGKDSPVRFSLKAMIIGAHLQFVALQCKVGLDVGGAHVRLVRQAATAVVV